MRLTYVSNHESPGESVMESNQRYYERRACEERRAAARSLTAEARARHGELADLFANRVRELQTGESFVSA
jgi:hypothetical protein